eukprot:69633_1
MKLPQPLKRRLNKSATVSVVTSEAPKGLKHVEMKLPQPPKRRLNKSATVSVTSEAPKGLKPVEMKLPQPPKRRLNTSATVSVSALIDSFSHDRIELKREKNSRAKFQITIRNYGKVSFRVNDGPTCEKLVNLINKKETQKESMDGQKSQLRSSEVTCEVSKDSKPEEMKLPQPPKRRLNKSTTVSVTSEAPKGLKPEEMKLPQPLKRRLNKS